VRERIEALRIGLKRGWTLEGSLVETVIGDANLVFGEDDELRLAFHSRRDVEALRKDLKWIGGSPWTVYAALGLEHFDEFAARIREDLESDFLILRDGYRREVEKAIRNGVEAKMRKQPDASKPEPHVVEALVSGQMNDFFKDFDSLEAFTLRRFQVAAMRALAEHGNETDAHHARRLIELGDRDITNECVSLLSRLGEKDDAPVLIEAAEKKLHFDDAVNAARAALTVSRNSVDTVTALIATGVPGLVSAAVSGLDDASVEDVVPIILPLLASKRPEIRRIGVDYLIRRLDRDQQARLIDLYIEHENYYYYNVVSRLDRSLYAPGWVRVDSKET